MRFVWLAIFWGTTLASLGADDVLASIDRLTTLDTDLTARYTVVHQPAEGAADKRVAQVVRRDRSSQFLVRTLAPASSAGKSYLRNGDGLWFYDPEGKQLALTDAKARFETSDVRLSDFSGSTWNADYTILSQKPEKLGRFDCTVYDLKAQRDDVLFARSVVWVSAEGLVRKVEDYSLSGDLVRRVLTPSWQPAGARWVPAKVLISDVLRHEETQITIDQVKVAPVDDAVFSQAYLDRTTP